jgi:hypothetical protein
LKQLYDEKSRNTGPLDIVSNTVGGTLRLQDNQTLILGGNNGAAQITGRYN